MGLVKGDSCQLFPEVRDKGVQGFLSFSYFIQKMEIMVILVFTLRALRVIAHFNGKDLKFYINVKCACTHVVCKEALFESRSF